MEDCKFDIMQQQAWVNPQQALWHQTGSSDTVRKHLARFQARGRLRVGHLMGVRRHHSSCCRPQRHVSGLQREPFPATQAFPPMTDRGLVWDSNPGLSHQPATQDTLNRAWLVTNHCAIETVLATGYRNTLTQRRRDCR